MQLDSIGCTCLWEALLVLFMVPLYQYYYLFLETSLICSQIIHQIFALWIWRCCLNYIVRRMLFSINQTSRIFISMRVKRHILCTISLFYFRLCNFTGSDILRPSSEFSSDIGQQSAYIVGEFNWTSELIHNDVSAIGCVVLLFGYIQATLWTLTSERQTFQMRQAVFRLLINQDITYFDTHNVGQMNTVLME